MMDLATLSLVSSLISVSGPVQVTGIPEISGAALETGVGILWTTPDSNNGPYLGRTSLIDGTTQKVRIQGAQNIDWEALAADGQSGIWILDVGDNDELRGSVQLHRFDPATVYVDATGALAVDVDRTLDVTLPAAADIEAGVVHAGKMILFQKSLAKNRSADVYSVPLGSTGAAQASLEGKLPRSSRITDASISPSGELYLLMTDKVVRCESCLSLSAAAPVLHPMLAVKRKKAESLLAIDDSSFLIGDESGDFRIND